MLVKVHGQAIEQAQQFTYLGSIMSIDGGIDKDINHQIGMAVDVFQCMCPVWSMAAINITTQIKLFKGVVITNCNIRF